jgi:hypothetical protein
MTSETPKILVTVEKSKTPKTSSVADLLEKSQCIHHTSDQRRSHSSFRNKSFPPLLQKLCRLSSFCTDCIKNMPSKSVTFDENYFEGKQKVYLYLMPMPVLVGQITSFNPDGPFTGCTMVGVMSLIAAETNGVLVPQHVAFARQWLHAVRAAEMTGVPVFIHGSGILPGKDHLVACGTPWLDLFRKVAFTVQFRTYWTKVNCTLAEKLSRLLFFSLKTVVCTNRCSRHLGVQCSKPIHTRVPHRCHKRSSLDESRPSPHILARRPPPNPCV